MMLARAVQSRLIWDSPDKTTVDAGNTGYFTAEFGLQPALMGIGGGLIFWRLGQRLDLQAEP